RVLAEFGATRVVECGPGKVLAGLMKRIDRNLQVTALSDAKALESALTEVGDNS
ncbi:MAG TPA: malonyl CoA-acyl carrier protein transacylase, partial [Gammaproteobacteria bacterium]